MSEGMFWGFVSLAIFVVGIPLTVFITKRYGPAPVLRRAVSFERLNVLAERLGGGLSLSFRGRDLDSVSRTYLALWHERGSAVRGSDILATDPLRVVVQDGDEILQARVLSLSNELNEFRIDDREGSLVLTFEYLDRHDGGVVEVLHTGAHPARILGTVPGATLKKPRKVSRNALPTARGKPRPRWWRLTETFVFLIAALGGTFFAVISALALVVGAVRKPALVDPTKYDLSTVAGQAAFATSVSTYGAWSAWQPIYSLVLIMSMVLAVLGWMFFTQTRRGVPREILEHDVGGFSKDEVQRLLEAGAAPDGDVANALDEAVKAWLWELRYRKGPPND